MGLKEAILDQPLWVRVIAGLMLTFSTPAIGIGALLLSPLLLPCLFFYGIYYFFFVVDKPELHYAPTHFNRVLVNTCPSLHQHFYPTPWAANPHVQNAMTDLRHAPEIEYTRTELPVHDSGVLALDWVHPPSETKHSPKTATPVLCVFHGLTGGSHEAYVRHLVNEVSSHLGWRCVVQNFRGCNSKLHSPRTYCAADTRDCKATINHVRRMYPHAKMYAAGFSLGSNVLVKAAGELGKSSPLSGVVSVSNPWDLTETSEQLNSTFMGRLYSKILGNNLKRFVRRNLDVLVTQEKVDVHAGLDNVKTVRQFDDHFTRHFFGYPSVEAYYKDASCFQYLDRITSPVLVLNARDDPICHEGVIPVAIAKRSSHVIVVTTSRGGHVSWLEGMYGERSWVDRVITEMLHAIHTHDGHDVPVHAHTE